MKREIKTSLQEHLAAADEHVKREWYSTSDESPEDRILYGVHMVIWGLKNLLALVKTED